MRLRDKIWIAFFSLAGVIFVLGVAYEFLYLEMTYKREESRRMDIVYKNYVGELERYLEESSKELQEKYIKNGQPQTRTLKSQDKYVYVSGKRGSWKADGEEIETPGRDDRGYIIEENRVLGYTQGVNGDTGIFRIDDKAMGRLEGYDYYSVEIQPYLLSKQPQEGIEIDEDSVVKSYYLPGENGHLMVRVKRDGVMFYRIINDGRRYVLWGTMGIALLILVGGRVFEKSVTYPIKRASNRLDNIIANGEFKEKVSLGDVEEMKGLERNINDILGIFRWKKQKYRLLYEGIPLITAILDKDLNLIEMNEYFAKKMKKGETREGESILNFIPADKVNLFTSLYRKLEENDEIENESFSLMDSEFNVIPVNISLKKIALENKTEAILLTALDVTKVNLQEKEGRDIMREDEEVGVYSKEYGSYYIEKYINMYRVSNFVFTVMLLWRKTDAKERGVSREEEVRRLREIADSIKKVVRGTDLVYRFDKNIFALLLPMMKESEMNQLKERISYAVDGISYDEETSSIRFVSERYNGKHTSMELEDNLYLKVRNARKSGERAGGLSENHLLKGLQREELELVYIPVTDGDGRLKSMEASLVWNNSRGIQLNHQEIYTLAEENQILNEVDRYLIERVEKDLQRGGVPISIKVTGEELEDERIVGAIKRIFFSKDTIGLFEIEVSGRDFKERREKVHNTLRELKSLGVGLTLSEVGGGDVSLADIGSFSFNKLKLSEDICTELERSSRNRSLVSSIVGAAKAGNREVIAGEIRRKEDASLLRELGCTFFYGRLIGGKGSYMEVMSKNVS